MGKRNQATTDQFIEVVRHATGHGRFQITTDGFAPYRSAISTTLSDRCDFAQLIEVYRAPQDGEKRYSPAEVQSVEVVPVTGRPDPERICTSIIERSNLSLRMGIRPTGAGHDSLRAINQHLSYYPIEFSAFSSVTMKKLTARSMAR